MKKFVRLLSLLLAAILLASALVGCGNKRKEGDPPVWTSNKTVVMKVGGYNVTYDFYKYLFLNTKTYYDNGEEDYWTKEGNDVEKVKEYVHDSIFNTYAMFKLVDKYDIKLSKDDLKEIDEYMKSTKESMGEEYQKELDLAYLSEELLLFVIKMQQLESLLYNHITDEASGILKVTDQTVYDAIDSDFVRATHILLTYKTDAEKETKMKEAQDILEQLKNGGDFEKIKDEKSEDTALKGKTDGYYFTHGEFVEQFEEAAFALKEGEISGIVESPEGIHIIKRMPIESTYVENNFETLRTQYLTRKYYDMIDEAKKDFKAEYTDEYKNITLDSFN